MSLFGDAVLTEVNRERYDAYIAAFDAHRVEAVRTFVDELAAYRGHSAFNPWGDADVRLDASDAAPEIRKRNLTAYLLPRLGWAHIFVVAEAVGYQGGRFSGIAITCERMLLGHHGSIEAKLIAPIPLERTSSTESELLKAIQREKGLNEPTDTVVWNAIAENRIDPYDTLLWNIFPFHPFKPDQPLTNRTPSEAEQKAGWQYTKRLLQLHNELGGAEPLILAVGQKSADTLESFGVKAVALRHPANGGANLYRKGFEAATRSRL